MQSLEHVGLPSSDGLSVYRMRHKPRSYPEFVISQSKEVQVFQAAL